MLRRDLLTATGCLLTLPLSGCLDSSYITPEGENDSKDAENGGIRSGSWLMLTNRTNERISATVNVDADGEKIVSDTFVLEAPPESVSTNRQRLERVPIGTVNLTVEAEIDFPDEYKEARHSFKLPKEYQIEYFSIFVTSDRRLLFEAPPVPTPD